jgi:hypothetical protein
MTFLPSEDMECFVLGDSAGANFALLAALLISNGKALQLFASTLDKEDSIDVQKLVLPRIDGILSIYGECRDWVRVVGLGLGTIQMTNRGLVFPRIDRACSIYGECRDWASRNEVVLRSNFSFAVVERPSIFHFYIHRHDGANNMSRFALNTYENANCSCR